MKRSDEINELAKAMAAFQGEVKQPKKDADNPFFKSKYVPFEAVVAAVSKEAPKHGLSFTQWPTMNEGGRIGVTTLLMHTSGQWMEFDPIFMKLEKDTAQAAGSVISYLKRYALSAAFGIASDEDDDGNEASKPAEKKNNNQQQSGNKQQQNRNTPPPQEPQQNQEPGTNNLITKYVNLLEKAGADTKQIFEEIAKQAGVANIRQVDKLQALGELKTRYAAIENEMLKNQQQNTENNTQQESLLEGRTTQPVNWGSK